MLKEETINVKNTPYALYNKHDWAMYWIEMYSGIDGSHHKDWLIDQIARILNDTNVIIKRRVYDDKHEEYIFDLDKPPQKYWDWVEEMKNGEDGPETYSYEFGIAP
jgi:hypothetical protein